MKIKTLSYLIHAIIDLFILEEKSMGYTHYFQQKKPVNDEQWAAFQHDAEILLNYIKKETDIVLESNDDNGILINDQRVNLNGDSSCDLDHETFYLEKDYRDFNFCKTARKPYDLVVCALLLLAHKHMPQHHDIGSDGSLAEWKEAMRLNAKLFNDAYHLPREVESSLEVEELEKELKNICEK